MKLKAVHINFIKQVINLTQENKIEIQMLMRTFDEYAIIINSSLKKYMYILVTKKPYQTENFTKCNHCDICQLD